jgi:ribosome-binding factor A
VDPLRTRRVEETMREELSEILRFEMADSRVTGLDVAGVHCAPDLSRADVLVAFSDPAADRTTILAALAGAAGFLRHQLMERMDLYRMPHLRFVAGSETPSGHRLRKLLRRARRGRSTPPAAE